MKFCHMVMRHLLSTGLRVLLVLLYAALLISLPVLSPPEVMADSLPEGLSITIGSITPPEPRVGDVVTVKVQAFNNSTRTINYQLSLKVNDKIVGSPQQINVEKGATNTATFQFTAWQPGVNTIAIGNIYGTCNIITDSPSNTVQQVTQQAPTQGYQVGILSGLVVAGITSILLLLIFLILILRNSKSVPNPSQTPAPADQASMPNMAPPREEYPSAKPAPRMSGPSWTTHHFQGVGTMPPPVSLVNNRYETTTREHKRGGMAVISLARDWQNGGQKVVIKTPRLEGSNSTQLNTEKLLQEAQYLKKVSHPHIVRFIDFFEDRQVPHLVLEYIDGTNLRKQFEFYPADEQSALRWGCQILNALEYIHDQGYIHRDLNPGNIMLGADQVKLIDFGTIKKAGSSKYTDYFKDGFIIPEVASEGWADARSDIYGVGGTLYYLLTCEPPGFRRGKNIIDLLTSKGVSRRLAGCIDQALKLEPSSRYDSAAAMRTALTGE